MGEDVSERLDIVPAQFRVVVTRLPKYACRACEEVVVQAPVPARLVDGGIPTEATVAHVLVSKYADHLPLGVDPVLWTPLKLFLEFPMPRFRSAYPPEFRRQMASLAFGNRCKDAGVRPSTGSVGDAYDNTMCESFFATLECELFDRNRFRSHSEARMAVFHFIEGFYNPSRRHSALGYLSPIEYERKHHELT